MKKLLIVALVFCFSIPLVRAFDSIDVSVENISQNKQDAEKIGARTGDVLRFDIDVTGSGDDFLDVDVQDILKKADIIDTGFGELQGTNLKFPVGQGSDMSFFVRLLGTCPANDTFLRAWVGDVSLRVQITDCGGQHQTPIEPEYVYEDEEDVLPHTGAQNISIIFVVLGIAILSLVGLSFVKK